MIWALFSKRPKYRDYAAPDGAVWRVEVRSPSASNAMVVFHHPHHTTTARDRYAWYLSSGPEASDVTARLDPADVLASLTAEQLRTLFRKSMPIASTVPRLSPL